jgi:hypothetical protein
LPQVGRIAAKSDNFLEYVKKAIQKLELKFEVRNETPFCHTS